MGVFTVPESVDGLYRIIPLVEFRRTPGVAFDILAKKSVPKTDSIDRVLHEKSAVSPGPVGDVERPWYMHPSQDDNLMVLAGVRHVDIYTPAHGRIERFDVFTDRIERAGNVIFDGPAMLVWPCGVFHRIVSGESGSASVNFATHRDGWNVRTNFNIFSLDEKTGVYSVIREGWQDQTRLDDE